MTRLPSTLHEAKTSKMATTAFLPRMRAAGTLTAIVTATSTLIQALQVLIPARQPTDTGILKATILAEIMRPSFATSSPTPLVTVRLIGSTAT